MSFKDNLRNRRNLANLSQERLAEQMSVSRQTVSKWENGDAYPSTAHILMLAKTLGCNVDALVDGAVPCHDDGASVSLAPCHHVRWLFSAAIAAALIALSLFVCIGLDHVSKITTAKAAVFDRIVDGSLGDAMGRLSPQAKIVGYGIREPDDTFYVKCNFPSATPTAPADSTAPAASAPCSAIIYFCKNAPTYECQLLDDPDYLPSGEYYALNQEAA